jgi:tRNA pseudouridine38-40 synthase
VTSLDLSQRRDSRGTSDLIEFNISANGFLRYMVRSMVGTLLAVGRNEIDEARVRRAIIEGDRSLVGPTAPANGLTLLRVEY